MAPPEQILDVLRQVRALSFIARSASPVGWNGRGRGTVEAQKAGEAALMFHEQGTWRPESSEREVRFHNAYRWTLVGDRLRLEHLRFGEANPVFLFDLARFNEGEWRSASPHLCREDCYSAVLLVRDVSFVLRWSIDGPRKQETIEYLYVYGAARGPALVDRVARVGSHRPRHPPPHAVPRCARLHLGRLAHGNGLSGVARERFQSECEAPPQLGGCGSFVTLGP